ncbi:Protein of unknown function DUF3527 [Macleaya cordata]|uniref:Uncharacterized protein n=1 Tax=Macleaya cordata TaxID=56857 RepID=A0A200PVV7_MACCD|nr:Protein of unknown function DUF3527 [Macleaya cordata]
MGNDQQCFPPDEECMLLRVQTHFLVLEYTSKFPRTICGPRRHHHGSIQGGFICEGHHLCAINSWRLKMGETFVDKQIDSQEDDSQLCLNKEIGSGEENGLEISEMKLKRLLGIVKPEQMLTSNDVKQLNSGESNQESFLQRRQHGLDVRIPKAMRFISFDEKYLQRCLDFLEFRQSNSVILYSLPTQCNISMNSKSSKMKILFDRIEPSRNSRRNTNDLGSFAIQCPLASGTGNVVIGPAAQWIMGTVDGKEKASSISMSPLFRHFGSPDNNMNLGRLGSVDVKATKYSEFRSSPSAPSFSSPQKLETETAALGNQTYGSAPLHKRFISISSTNSTCSNQVFSSASTTVSQGMLHWIWKSGIPHFVFSVDDQNEVYVANLWKVESTEDKDLDYMYLFHSRTSVQKIQGSCDIAADLLGKMKVSNTLSLCSDNSKVTETEFVLFGAKEKHIGDTQSLVPTLRKNKGTPQKVVDMLRTKHLFKHSSTPKIGGPSSILEDFSLDPCEDICNKLDASGRRSLLECPQGLELAAIVVKNHLRDNSKEATVGGWGLKFLEKARVRPANTSLEASVSSDIGQESCHRTRSDCSTSTTVLVPVGIHGGPRTKNGGPSSLTERWRSGGKCDCGGWDIGCPLTILNNRPSKQEELSHANAQEEYKSCDLFIEGAKQDIPTLRMVNIHDGLYVIHFQSTLSALQAFSIGVANIHTQNPTLCAKNVQKLKQQKSGVRFM